LWKPSQRPNRSDSETFSSTASPGLIAVEERHGLTIAPEQLRAEALEWSTTRGARSGRTAFQYDRQAVAGDVGVDHRQVLVLAALVEAEPEAEPVGQRAEALEWSTTRGARSGRTAFQYIQDLAGRLGQRLVYEASIISVRAMEKRRERERAAEEAGG
jgi:hypothetical protein